MRSVDYAPPVPPDTETSTDRISRREAAALLDVSLGRFDVIARTQLTSRVHNELRNRTTYSRAEVEALAEKRRGV